MKNATKIYLVIVSLLFASIALQAFYNPQSVMDFVEVQLNNISARNSIRAFYGGVNLALAIFLFYGAFKNQSAALLMLIVYGLGFIVGRLYSIAAEGQPSNFILTWLVIETTLCTISIILKLKLKTV